MNLFGASGKACNRLQRVQNNLERAVFDIGHPKVTRLRPQIFRPVTRVHWLPVQASITYKVALLCFKCYKLGMLQQYRPTRSLRLSSLDILSVPRSRTKTAFRRFSIAAPSVGTAFRLQSGLLPASVHSDRSSKHTCSILAFIDHSRYPHFCSFGIQARYKH